MPKPFSATRIPTHRLAALCTFCLVAAALLSYGQPPDLGPPARVLLGLPRPSTEQQETQDQDPWSAPGELATLSGETTRRHSLTTLSTPGKPTGGNRAQATLTPPRLLRELPPLPDAGEHADAIIPDRDPQNIKFRELPPLPSAGHALKSIAGPKQPGTGSADPAKVALAAPRLLTALPPTANSGEHRWLEIQADELLLDAQPDSVDAPVTPPAARVHSSEASQAPRNESPAAAALPLDLLEPRVERKLPPPPQKIDVSAASNQPEETAGANDTAKPAEAAGPAANGFDEASLYGVLPAQSPATQSPATQSPATQSPATQSPAAMPAAKPSQEEKSDADSRAPQFFVTAPTAPQVGQGTRRIPYQGHDFQPSVPTTVQPLDPLAEELVYRGKFPVPTQRPWIEWGKPLYSEGVYLPGKDWFGSTNLVRPHFMVYGDFRTGVGVNRNASGDANSWANRLNLDMDLAITATERLHAFMGPLDRGGDFTRLDFTDSAEFVDRTDLRFDTLFFEGDLGSIVGGVTETGSPFDLPFTFGFLPLIYQNGIWAADNVIGAAVALPARHNRSLNWSNYDATFFWASDQVNSDAFAGDNNAAEFFGTAWFIDAYDGYIEADYAFVHDDVGGHRSYHNMSFSFTRRYFARISNSVRWITNFGQSLPDDQKTASGNLLLIENSLISAYPNTFVPYCNLFYGQGRPQSLARAGIAGGILTNTGINFEIDGLTGYPTLDATGSNAYGAALGVNLLGTNFSQQLVLEMAALQTTGSPQFRNAPGDQYAIGMRYQKPLSNAWLFRTDHMYGWRNDATDLRGSRFEFRWKF